MAPGQGTVGAAYWNSSGRARRYQAVVAGTAERDPLFSRLRRAARRSSTVVDVGAGTGRFSLALAPKVGEVVAVDPSKSMLGVLKREARRQGIANLRTVESRWQDVVLCAEPDGQPPPNAVPMADVVVCSYVLPLIEDAAGFLAKMDDACRGRAYVYLNALSADAVVDPLWRHFHGRRRAPAPTFLDAAAILSELGLDPDIEVVEVATMSRFENLFKAVRSYREMLLLPDTAAVRAELRSLLSSWLVEDRGILRPPVKSLPAAIISWEGRGGDTAQVVGNRSD